MSESSFVAERGAMRYFRALSRHALLIGSLCVLGLVVAALSTYATTKRYAATADIVVRPLSTNDTTYTGFNSVFQQAPDASVPVVTAARLIDSPEIRTPCLAGLPADARGSSISITPLGQADVLEIKAETHSAAGAAAAANGFADCVLATENAQFTNELKSRIRTLRARIDAIPASARQGNFEYAALQQQLAAFVTSLGTPNPTVALLSRASVPASPVWPRPKLALGASLLVALLLGIGISLLLEFVTPRISHEEDLRLQQRLPILARIPRLSRNESRAYMSGKAPFPPQAWKGYRVLRAVLAHSGAHGGYPRTIVVTSAMLGDGKTTSAINLALTLARADLRVTLIDADVHRPMIASFFNVAAHRNGFARLLRGDANLSDVSVKPAVEPNLTLVLASPEGSGYAGLTEARARTMLEKVAATSDVVVVDCPPLTEVAEVVELAGAAEVLLLAVRLGRTRRDKLEEARELLAQRGVSPAGFIVTTRDRVERETYYDYPGEPARGPRSVPAAAAGTPPSSPAKAPAGKAASPPAPVNSAAVSSDRAAGASSPPVGGAAPAGEAASSRRRDH